jgi:PAS domain S-box-containing protein
LIDMQGQILYESASASKLFGYQPEELVGRNCLDLIHPEDREQSARALRDVVAKPLAPSQREARVRHYNGNYFWAESTLSNLLSELEVQAIVIRQRGISARKAMETERKLHAEELTRSKLRFEEFAYTAAHDLREPLRAISLYTELLIRKTPMDFGIQKDGEIHCRQRCAHVRINRRYAFICEYWNARRTSPCGLGGCFGASAAKS